MSNPNPEIELELAFITWEGMGHLVPMVELAKLILHRNQTLSISILVMRTSMDFFGADKYLSSLTSDSGHPRLRFVDLRQYNDSHGGEEIVFKPENFLFDFIQSQTANVRRFVQANYASSSHRPRLVGFVIDMFCAPMIDVANEFNAPTYLFFASSIPFLALSFHFQALKHDHKEDTSRYKNSEAELSIPCYSNPVPAKVLPSLMVEKNPAADSFFDGVKRYKETKGIMVNTFAELDHYALQALSHTKTVPPIYPVGPLLNLEAGHGRNKASQSEIIKWLDDQPPSSVVFLCFGSLGSFEETQVKKIANALELTGHRFLWSLRRRPPKGKLELPADYENLKEVLPEGFLERTKEVGKVIGWAPQLAVLSHAAVGGFVSHCGWNSTLESIWCGVPIAAWPLYAEQQINAFKLVMELGIAAEIRMDYIDGSLEGIETDNIIVTTEEIQKGIMKIMSNGDIRKKVKELKEMSRKAVIEGGSSYKALDTAINAIVDNCNNI